VISDCRHAVCDAKNAVEQPLFGVPTPTLELGCIHGATTPNRICAKCALELISGLCHGIGPGCAS